MQEEDVIVIHLGRVLTDAEFDEVLKSVVAFMNVRWPDNRFTLSS